MLGLSSPFEREQIAWEYFENDDAFQEMLAAEDDLIDAYARGELIGEERRHFEKSFGSSLREGKRIRFARAFAGVITESRPVEAKLLDIIKTFRLPAVLRTATIAATIVLVAWLVVDRRRMTNELRELRLETLALSKRTELLQQSSDIERTQNAEFAAQLAGLKAQPEKPRHHERATPATQRVRHLREIKNDREEMVSSKSEQTDDPNTSNASIGNTFESRRITELPLDANNVVGLLSLQPGTTRPDSINGGRADQANITLKGVDVTPLNTYTLTPRDAISLGETTIRLPNSLEHVRLKIALERETHKDYRVIVKTIDGRPIPSLNWIEPFKPSQSTLTISAYDFPTGDYVLLLMGKEPDGSYVKVAEYVFKVVN